jgi:hypothetical protein
MAVFSPNLPASPSRLTRCMSTSKGVFAASQTGCQEGRSETSRRTPIDYSAGRSVFARAFEPFQRSMGFDGIPELLRSEVLSAQQVRQDLVLGY